MTTELSAALVVGLRNPGSSYELTRHNVGAVAVDRFLTDHNLTLKRARQRVKADVAETNLGGRRAVVAVPRTFMNESGQAVAPLVKYFGIEHARVLIVHDDIDLSVGRLKVQEGGGHGGNNGVRSVIGSLGSNDFWRLKIGVGRPPRSMDPADHVLGKFRSGEQKAMDVAVYRSADLIASFIESGGDQARQFAGELND